MGMRVINWSIEHIDTDTYTNIPREAGGGEREEEKERVDKHVLAMHYQPRVCS